MTESSQSDPPRESAQTQHNPPSAAEDSSSEDFQPQRGSAYTIVETWFGRMLVNIHDRYIGRTLQIYGEYGRDEVEVLTQVLPPSGAVLCIDAGANIGPLTVPLARHLGMRAGIHAFEPQRLIYQMLCANLALNECWNVFTHQLGLGDVESEMFLPVAHPHSVNFNWGGVNLIEGYESGEEIKVIRLDDMNYPAVHLIKADVEGMEIQMLRGSENTLLKSRPVLYLENDRKEKSRELLEMLIKEFKYDIWWHYPPVVTTNNHNCIPDDFTPMTKIVSLNILCLPQGPDHNIQGPFIRVEDLDYWPPDHWETADRQAASDTA
ncbi:MAG: FkbM family methyltransferase [Gammaproteobacteria bacterium AqS3]|nr:FkbM family methyltransferase [Gammaproteobacteria bacterium AqS3]